MSALKDTLLDVLLKPGATFRDAHPDVSLWPALSFVLIFGCLGVMLSMTIDFVSPGIRAGASIATATEGFMGLFRWILLLVPLRIIASTFVNAGLLHLALMVTGANTLRYGASFRICAYCGGATAVFGAVPVIGHWVGLIALFLVQVPAIKHMHKTTDGKAAFAAIAPIILRWTFFGGLALAGIYSIASLFG